MTTLLLARRRISARRLLAVMAAAVTGIAVYSYLASLRARVPAAGGLAPMVVAARDLEPGTSIEPGMLSVVQHPERYLPEGALRSTGPAVGRVVAVPIFEGEPITARRLGRSGGRSSTLPAGMRAYSMAVEPGAGLGAPPKPGDRVDVLATFAREVLGEATTLTVLRWAEVAAAGPGPGPSGRFGPEPAGDGLRITLLVTPEQAEQLAMAESLGRVTVVLAPAKPDGGSAPPPVTPRDVGR